MTAIPAAHWQPLPADKQGLTDRVQCLLCPHNCVIAPGAAGRCRVRRNYGGRLYSLSSPAIACASADPIEKKPLYHFYPGSISFSIGTAGCNMRCCFCQNHSLSQMAPPETEPLPDDSSAHIAQLTQLTQLSRQVVDAACAAGAKSIAYTYSEPTIFYELVEACAQQAAGRGLANVLVSNGFISKQAFAGLQPRIQAANFDLKSFSDAFYRRYCSARLQPVLETLERAVAAGIWVELTTLLIPGLNDSPEELYQLASFIKSHLGAHVPWHISRFRPCYKLQNIPVTPLASIETALAAGKSAGLHYVYAGNIPGHSSESTYCPSCSQLFMQRHGYTVTRPASGCCSACKTPIAGVWEDQSSQE